MRHRSNMHLEKLSLSYKCHSSIGNSLKLNEMLTEVLNTFVEETFAVNASAFLLKNEEKIITVGKKLTYDIQEVLDGSSEQSIVINEYNLSFSLLVYQLEKVILVFVYDNEMDLDFIISMFESFRKKLNISIDSCFNVKCLEQSNKELSDLTENLQIKVNEAIRENKQKEKQIFEQLKMSQMGELIGNIAHQWRQPLNVISTATSGMKLKKEINILTDEDFYECTNSVLNNVQFLSTTIDEFRDYIKESHRQKEVIIQDRVKMALSMVESTFSVEGIEIIEEFIEPTPIQFRLIIGELLQVLISIFNNAKEALIQNQKGKKWIRYAVFQTEASIIITIEDNGGGIDETIIDKIFNPYFTTKHKSQGTGIGLYTSYDIIAHHLDGNLRVKNTDDGAKFFIELPIFMDYSI